MNFTVVGNQALSTSSEEEIKHCQKKLNVNFEKDYVEYVTKYGAGILGGSFIRIYTPNAILDTFDEWKERIEEYWFWDEGKDVLSKQEVLNSIIIGDTLDGDEIIFYNNEYFILPHEEEMIYRIGKTLKESIEWLCSSGILTEPFDEREFEPF